MWQRLGVFSDSHRSLDHGAERLVPATVRLYPGQAPLASTSANRLVPPVTPNDVRQRPARPCEVPVFISAQRAAVKAPMYPVPLIVRHARKSGHAVLVASRARRSARAPRSLVTRLRARDARVAARAPFAAHLAARPLDRIGRGVRGRRSLAPFRRRPRARWRWRGDLELGRRCDGSRRWRYGRGSIELGHRSTPLSSIS